MLALRPAIGISIFQVRHREKFRRDAEFRFRESLSFRRPFRPADVHGTFCPSEGDYGIPRALCYSIHSTGLSQRLWESTFLQPRAALLSAGWSSSAEYPLR